MSLQPPGYSETCRSLSPEDIQKLLHAGEKPVLHFNVVDVAMIEFKNRVRGKQRFLGKHIAISSSAIISRGASIALQCGGCSYD